MEALVEDVEEYSDETDAERQAREDLEIHLDELSQATVDNIIEKLLLVVDELSGHPLRPYQKPFARRLIESLIIGDGSTLTFLAARQSGKSETISNTVAACMIMLPRLAKIFPALLEKFAEGLWVGAFAPVEDQADTLYGRIVSRLTSDRATAIMADPEIDEEVFGRSKELHLKKSGSLVRKQTAHPRAIIEGRTYHLILIDECFPAGTPVLTSEGWVPIERIVEGDRRDWIVATQGTDSIEWVHVNRTYRTRRHNDLVRVDHEHGSLYATANHPFMVGGEEVPAIHLRPGQALSLVQTAAKPAGTDTQAVSPVNGGGLQQFAQSAPSELDAGSSGPGADLTNPEGHGTSPYYPWGQRQGSDETPADVARRLGHRVDRRACDRYWSADQGRAADALQGGSGEPREADRGGDRRRLALHPEATGAGPAQDVVVGESRVVRVEVLEPGSAEFTQFSDGADYVYTLEVDHPSHTYVVAGVVVGNCQGADEVMVNKSIGPMGASTNATMVFTGTPTYTKGVFYKTIQLNKRQQTKRGARQNHYEADWKTVAKSSKNYERFVKKEMLRIGEDADEFKLAYRLIWLLDRGMFVTNERLDELGDKSMEIVPAYHRTPILIGIDPARKVDSTIVTALWVDWDRPDEFGYFDHRVLNWLDLSGMDWEQQYFRIKEFIANYRVLQVGIDSGGVGDVVASRLRVMMPHLEIVDVASDVSTQSKRWKHLSELVDRGKIGWPAHAKTRRLKTWQRFRQQMEDLEKTFKGPNMLAAAPNERDAHDDYCDSLAIACSLTKDAIMPTIEVSNFNFLR